MIEDQWSSHSWDHKRMNFCIPKGDRCRRRRRVCRFLWRSGVPEGHVAEGGRPLPDGKVRARPPQLSPRRQVRDERAGTMRCIRTYMRVTQPSPPNPFWLDLGPLVIIYQSRASDSERGFGSSERLTYVAGYLWTPTWLSPWAWNFQELMGDGGGVTSAKKKSWKKSCWRIFFWRIFVCFQPNPIWSLHAWQLSRLWGLLPCDTST